MVLGHRGGGGKVDSWEQERKTAFPQTASSNLKDGKTRKFAKRESPEKLLC
jgi:hypothetical protein